MKYKHLLFIIFLSFFACKSSRDISQLKLCNTRDSLLYKNIKEYVKRDNVKDLLVMEYLYYSPETYNFTISCIGLQNQLEAYKSAYYINDIDGKIILVLDYMKDRIVFGTKLQPIDSVLYKKLYNSLTPEQEGCYILYEPTIRYVSYLNGMLDHLSNSRCPPPPPPPSLRE